MASKQDVLRVLSSKNLSEVLSGDLPDSKLKVSNLDKFYNRLNIDETQLTNDDIVLWGQVWGYIHDGEVGTRIFDIENTQNKEENDQLEKDYGIRVVFSDKD